MFLNCMSCMEYWGEVRWGELGNSLCAYKLRLRYLIVNLHYTLPETSIRTDVCSRLGGVAVACTEASMRAPRLKPAAEQHVLPLVARLLGDEDTGVRKAAYGALLQLMEQRCVPRAAVELHVCPRVVHYTRQDALMDYQTGAVTVSVQRLCVFYLKYCYCICSRICWLFRILNVYYFGGRSKRKKYLENWYKSLNVLR